MSFWQLLKDLIGFPAAPSRSYSDSEILRPVPKDMNWRQVTIENAPVEGGGHTTYTLYPGAEPGTVTPFPDTNFFLTTPEHQEEARVQIEAMGFTFLSKTKE